ncbi:zinc-binding dehydrogenase [Pseudomonas fluorescens]|uniref:zinc-binding dehydrogenase n=1 Tax=Pseudomonas fluorescens TaxID=294 RepID=UPI001241217A
MRTQQTSSLYLKDLTFHGCTFQKDAVFDELVSHIEHGRIRSFVSNSYPLSDIAKAQNDFIEKRYAGKLVLVPGESGYRRNGRHAHRPGSPSG